MSITITYYSILGISETATVDEIKKAYRVKARTQHPDLQRQNGLPVDEDTFKLINEAYKILGNQESRDEYDRSLKGETQSTPEEEESSWGEESTFTTPEEEEETVVDDEEIVFDDTPEEDFVEEEPRYTETDPDQYSVPASRAKKFSHSYNWEIDSPVNGEFQQKVTPSVKGTKAFLSTSLGAIAFIWAYFLISMNFLDDPTSKLIALIGTIIISTPAGFTAIPPRAYEKVIVLKALRGISYGLTGLIIASTLLFFQFLPMSFASITAYITMRLLVKNKYGAGIIPDTHVDMRTWGTAGDLSDAVSKFGYNRVEWGIKGEKTTALLLDDFVKKLKTATVFHGLQFPGSMVADVDHAVLYGNRLALIDSKMWKPAYYQFGTGVIEVHDFNNGEVEMRETSFHTAVERYAKMFPDLEVFGWYFIHSTQERKNVEIGRYNVLGSTHMGTPEEGMEAIGSWFVDGKNKKKNTINRKTIFSLATNLK